MRNVLTSLIRSELFDIILTLLYLMDIEFN